uniref:Uncharacterized protein n=1 Tax=Rhizophora mucronata TaxID=61149 RepID=A0A2P2NK29_RHIMU
MSPAKLPKLRFMLIDA